MAGDASSYFADDARHPARQFAPAVNLFLAFMNKIDAVESREDMIDKAGPPLLAVRKQV